MKTIYRVHITCIARHTTYQDYKTKRAAMYRWLRGDIDGWIATHIEVIKVMP